MDEEENPGLAGTEIVRYHGGEKCPADDVVAREEPLEVRLNGQPLVYLMRLPGDDAVLAAGFCFSEGLISSREDIELLHHCLEGESPGEVAPGAPGNLVEMRAKLASGAERFDVARVVRTGCGGADLEREIDLAGIEVDSDVRFSPEVVSRVPDLLLEGQEVFRKTGGTHGAGVFDTGGRVLVVKEDVGRHNAVDKVLGYLLLSGESTADKGLILSGRLSYEMVLKGARAGIPLLCSVSAPTALGVEVGRKTGVTLVGFLRNGSFNVYSHPERVGGG
ncbi:MAG: formate dehydrogenase accessory sulfurtransferase FdhD [Actinobacteria bacterium]|nr:formate dehydrogenase accessory sulfurtransferase FdhD [Actinomycetota bacterium]